MGTQRKLAAVILFAVGWSLASFAGSSAKNEAEVFAEFGNGSGDFCSTLCAGPGVTDDAYRSCVLTCGEAKDESYPSESDSDFVDE